MTDARAYGPGDYFAFAASIEAALGAGVPAMMPLMRRLFPICRSLTGEGVRETLRIVEESIPLERTRVPTGTQCFDWEVPREWNIRDAYVANERGERVIDFRKSNLHLVNYSVPVRARLSRKELDEHLHSLPDQPDAIPYRASYYHESWGFCLTHRQREQLADGPYEVVIDSTLAPGEMEYAQSFVPGAHGREIFYSTYFCHPSLANDQLSGIVLLTMLMGWLRAGPRPRYSHRALFAPETIGPIVFLSQHHERVKATMEAGYVVTCVGDEGPFTYVRSKRGRTAADRAAEHVLRHPPHGRAVSIRDFDPVGSDERQYCSPGLNLPVGSLMRSRFGEFKEYHTSKDDLTFVTEEGLAESLEAYLRVVQTLEMNCRPLRTNPYCEPQLSKRGLYSTLVTSGIEDFHVKLLNILSFADGEHDLIDIADRLRCPIWHLAEPLRRLVEADLIRLDLEEAPVTATRRVLLAAHDRGGVNLLMPLLRHWGECEPRIAASFIGAPMVAYELRHMLPSPVDVPATAGMRRDAEGIWRYDDAELSAILASAPWDLVLTGTSLMSDLETSLWRLARARSIPTAALCDMWTEYVRRFQNRTEPELPGRILVLDDRMADEVRDALGSIVAIDVVGSPHFADLLAAARRGDTGRAHVRFISEPAAALFPRAGVHEFEIAEMIIGVLERQGMASRLLLRPHPLDDAEAWRRFAAAHRTKGVRLDDEPSWSCHRSTAMAVGISSMMLIELAIAGVPVASFHPEGADEAYYCLPEKEFQITRLRNARDVEAWVRTPEPPRVSPEFIALHAPAIARITDVVLGGPSRE